MNIRIATEADLPAMTELMDLSISQLLKPYLPPEGVEGSFDIMGLDTQLVKDRTYYVVDIDTVIAGCGGWSRRATLFGGDHTSGREPRLLNPKTEPARVRAMYTHPGYTRRGIGRLVLETCEAAAAGESFKTVQLAATLAGEPLYTACGYTPVEHFSSRASNGVDIPLILMEKPVDTK
ncbi:MAG: GNAT family N-acetyltransferase [Pseudomonadota bacterium]